MFALLFQKKRIIQNISSWCLYNTIVPSWFVVSKIVFVVCYYFEKKRWGGYLSKSSYAQKRSALGHLFRCHNDVGFPEKYKGELVHLFNGFFRQLATNPRANRGGAGDDANAAAISDWNKEEGKEPMSVELYIALCGWFLSMGTHRGIFAHLYLVLTWNLACRSNNTVNIKLSDIVWSTSFDSFHILFRHSKTDPMGDDSKYPRHNELSIVFLWVVRLSFFLLLWGGFLKERKLVILRLCNFSKLYQ